MDHTERRMARLEEMKAQVYAGKRLKEVFGDDWFEEARQAILAARGAPALKMPSHAAFIAFVLDDIMGHEANLVRELDEAFDVVSDVTRKRLSPRLRSVVGELDEYVSTAFEMLVLARFAKCGLLDEHEPKIESGRPEARVRLADQAVLIEARATLDGAFPISNGAVDPDEHAFKLASKLGEKYRGQLAAAEEPVVLFIALNQGLHLEGEEVRRALAMVEGDSASKVVSVIVVADDYKVRRCRTWRNPRAQRALTDDAHQELEKVLA